MSNYKDSEWKRQETKGVAHRGDYIPFDDAIHGSANTYFNGYVKESHSEAQLTGKQRIFANCLCVFNLFWMLSIVAYGIPFIPIPESWLILSIVMCVLGWVTFVIFCIHSLSKGSSNTDNEQQP